jgi:hypothetical protein
VLSVRYERILYVEYEFNRSCVTGVGVWARKEGQTDYQLQTKVPESVLNVNNMIC